MQEQTEVMGKEKKKEWKNYHKPKRMKREKENKSVCKTQKQEQCCFHITLPVDS